MVASLSVVGVLRRVVVVALAHQWVLVAESVMGCSIVLALVVWHHCGILVIDGSGVCLVLQLDVRLLLVRVVGSVRVEVGGHLVVDRAVVHDAWLVVVLVLRHALDEVARRLVVEIVVQVIVAVMVFTQVVMVDQARFRKGVMGGIVDEVFIVLALTLLVVVVVGRSVDWSDNVVRQDCGVMGGDDVVDQCGCVERSDDVVSGIVDEVFIVLALTLLVVVLMGRGVDGSDVSVGIGGVMDEIFIILALTLLVVVVVASSVVWSHISVSIGGVVDEILIFFTLIRLVVVVVGRSVDRSDDFVGHGGGVMRNHNSMGGGIGSVMDEILIVFALTLLIVVVVASGVVWSHISVGIGSAVDEIVVILALTLLVVIIVTCSVVRSDISVSIGAVDEIVVVLALTLLVVVVVTGGVVRSNISVSIGAVDEIVVSLGLTFLVVIVVTCGVVRGDVSVGISGVVDKIIVVFALLVGGGQGVLWDAVLHLAAKEDLGEGKTERVAVLVEVLVLPLGLSIHDLVVDILTIDNQVVLNMEDEVPWVSESLRHLAELVKISADGGLALLELVSDIVDDVTEILDSVKHRVEGSMLKLVLDTAKALPDVLGVTEALDTVRNLSLDGASEETLKDLAHAEECEVDVRALHGLEVVHLLVLLVVDLVEKLLPVVVEVVEELLMVDHLGLAVEKHG